MIQPHTFAGTMFHAPTLFRYEMDDADLRSYGTTDDWTRIQRAFDAIPNPYLSMDIPIDLAVMYVHVSAPAQWPMQFPNSK